jgi:hypothetical protein
MPSLHQPWFGIWYIGLGLVSIMILTTITYELDYHNTSLILDLSNTCFDYMYIVGITFAKIGQRPNQHGF